MPAAKDGLTPELRQKFAELKTALGAGAALVKLSRMISGSATAEPIMAAPNRAIHRATWDELGDLVSWVATRPGVVPGEEYIVQAYADRNGDGQPRGAPKAAGSIRIPSVVDQARQATAAQQAQVAAEGEMLRGKAAAQLNDVQRVGEEARRAMATEAEVLAAAKANPAGADPAVIERSVAASAEAQKQLAQVMRGFQETTFAFQRAMVQAPAQAQAAAPAQTTPTVQAGVVTPTPAPAGTVLVARGDGTYQFQAAPAGTQAPAVPMQPVKVENGYLMNGTFYPTPAPTSARDGELAEIREQLRAAQADARTVAETMRRQLDDEKEARREAERKADAAKADAERRADAAKNEAALKTIQDQMARQADDHRRDLEKLMDDNRRALEDLKKGDSGDKSDKWLAAMLTTRDKAEDANAKHMADMMAANERANEKVLALMKEAQNTDSAEVLQKTMSSMMQVFALKDSMTDQMLRHAMQLQGPKSSPLVEAFTKINETLPGMVKDIIGGIAGQPAGPDPNEPPALPPPEPARALPPVPEPVRELPPPPPPAPTPAETLLATARDEARAGRLEDALQILFVAARKEPAIVRPNEDAAAFVRRAFAGAASPDAIARMVALTLPPPAAEKPPPPVAEQPTPAAG